MVLELEEPLSLAEPASPWLLASLGYRETVQVFTNRERAHMHHIVKAASMSPPSGRMRRDYRNGAALRLAAVIGIVIALNGCAAFHLYDKADDKLAADAATAYADSKITETIKIEHANLDTLEQREINAFLKVNAAERDLMLLSLLSDSKTPFVERFRASIEARLSEIVGKQNVPTFRASLQDILDKRQAVETATFNELNKRLLLVDFDHTFSKLPVCNDKNKNAFNAVGEDGARAALKDDNYKFPAAIAADVGRAYQDYVVKGCRPLLEAISGQSAKFDSMPGSALKEASDALDGVKADLDERQTKLAIAKAELKRALDEVTAASKAKDVATQLDDLTCPTDQDDSAPPPNNLCKALASLKKLGDSGIKVISEEQLAKIDLVLVALSGSATDKDEKKMPAALALLSTSARFAGALKAYQTAGTYPALEPLLIEKQLQTARLATATKAVALQKAQLDAARDLFEALQLEGDMLDQANALLGGFGPKIACGKDVQVYCLPVSRMFDEKAFGTIKASNGEPAGRLAYRALALYSESHSIARARQVRARMKTTLSSYRDALNRSEASLAMWDGLIATPMSQLKSYYAGGIKSEEIAQFLQAIGVIGIAERIK
jgi:hypothetical protein